MTTATEILTVDTPQLKAWEISERTIKVIPQGSLIAVVRKTSAYSGPIKFEVYVTTKHNSGDYSNHRIPVASLEAGLDLIARKMS